MQDSAMRGPYKHHAEWKKPLSKVTVTVRVSLHDMEKDGEQICSCQVQVWEAGFCKVTAQGLGFFSVIELFCILIVVKVTQTYLVLKLIELYIKTIVKYVNFF